MSELEGINLTLKNSNITLDCNKFNHYLSEYIHPFVYFSYITIMIVSVTGNGLVCYLVLSTTRMRTVTNFFIVNLSAGDLLMTSLCVPFSFVSSLIFTNWPFGNVMCRVTVFFQCAFVGVSSYTLVAISIDRYIAIMSPLKPRMSKSTAKTFIAAIWVGACITAFPIFYTSETFIPDDGRYKSCKKYICQERWDKEEEKFYYTTVLMFLQYGVPFFVLVYTYTRIAIVVWWKTTPGEAENGRDQRLAKGKRRMIKMMVTVVVVFTICWLPFHLLQFFIDYEIFRNWEGLPYLWFALHWLAMSHTCYNPFIYAFMNNRFTMGFIGILSKFQCMRYLLSKCYKKALSDLTFEGGECGESLQRRHTTTTYVSVERKNGDQIIHPKLMNATKKITRRE